jgi:hypothetical protein
VDCWVAVRVGCSRLSMMLLAGLEGVGVDWQVAICIRVSAGD